MFFDQSTPTADSILSNFLKTMEQVTSTLKELSLKNPKLPVNPTYEEVKAASKLLDEIDDELVKQHKIILESSLAVRISYFTGKTDNRDVQAKRDLINLVDKNTFDKYQELNTTVSNAQAKIYDLFTAELNKSKRKHF